MNPETGKIHLVEEVTNRLAGRVNPKANETAEEVLKRATEKHAQLNDGEFPPGSVMPSNFVPILPGQELKQVKGWRMIVQSVDVEEQIITVKAIRR